MEKPAETQYPIHELLQRRWSPRAFSDQSVSPEHVRSLLEAARWAPSSNNEQPWTFLVATKQDQADYERLLSCLRNTNQLWARLAPVLAMSIAKLVFTDDGEPNRHAFHDVGLAVENLVVQATALGLMVHQMAGIYPDKVRELYGIPGEYEVVAAIAIGYPDDPEILPEKFRQRELAKRFRKPIADFTFAGHWGRPSPIVEG
ncbi:MAG: nitroreductase family protein [Nitrospirales bacterium]|nr:nitroreductase family protein [Nitrospirales bacterium]